MTNFLCPCCNAPMAERSPVEVLLHGPMRPLVRRAVEALIDIYPRKLYLEQLVTLVYANEPTGGPLHARSSLLVSFSHANKHLRLSGWRIGAFEPGARGAGTIGLYPL